MKLATLLIIAVLAFLVGIYKTEAASPASGSVPAAATAVNATSKFQLGKHYEMISAVPAKSADQIEVAVVFWYGCPHCLAFEPVLEQWRRSVGVPIKLVRIPAMFPLARLHAQAFFTAEAVGKINEMHDAFFTEI